MSRFLWFLAGAAAVSVAVLLQSRGLVAWGWVVILVLMPAAALLSWAAGEVEEIDEVFR